MKKSVLVRRKALELFVNTLTADEKYSLLNRDNLANTNSDAIISKTKTFLAIFSCIFEMCIKFNTFSKKT